MRLGIVNHLGWAVAVVTDDDLAVVARSRIELVDPGLPTAPVHHHGGTWPAHDDRARTDDELVELVQQVRASVRTAVDRAFADLASGAARSEHHDARQRRQRRGGLEVLVDDRGVVWIRDTTATVLIPAATP